MLNIYRVALEACKYRAIAFLSMVVEMGGVATAKKLLAGEEMQSGLYELFECGRLDLTVEALMLQPKFRELFAPDELAIAEQRLADLGYKAG
jgi:hypothetical protein